MKRTQSHPDREVQLSNVLYSVIGEWYDRADLLIVRVPQTFPQSLDYKCMERGLGGISIILVSCSSTTYNGRHEHFSGACFSPPVSYSSNASAPRK